jgi:hypothetical protein
MASEPRAYALSRALDALLLSLVLLGLGCESEPERAEPTAPWLAREPTAAPSDARAQARRYVVRPGAELRFSLLGKLTSLEGRVPVNRGELFVEPTALESLRGQLELELEQLRVGSRGGPEDELSRATALAWLGLGTEVRGGARQGLGTGRLRVSLARQLSERSAARGEELGSAPGPGGATGVTRRVHATLATDLTLRRVEVAHAPRVALDFHFERGARPGEAPGALTLTLLTPERVPLAEHDIRPRDERGSLLSRELGRLGTELGTVAEVSGSVDLVLDAGSSGESAGTAP